MNNTLVITVGGHDSKTHAQFLSEYLGTNVQITAKRKKWYQRHVEHVIRAQNVSSVAVKFISDYANNSGLPLKVKLF